MKFEKLSENKFQSLTKDEMNKLFGGVADTNTPGPGTTCGDYTWSAAGTYTPDPRNPTVTYKYSNDWTKPNANGGTNQHIQIGSNANNDYSCDELQKNNPAVSSLSMSASSSMLAQANLMPQSALGLLM